MPYVIFFLISMTMGPVFKQKLEKESMEIKFDEDENGGLVEERREEQLQQMQEKLSQGIMTKSVIEFEMNLTETQLIKIHRKDRLIAAKYKISFVIWKCSALWPIFDFFSRYFVVFVYITIFCFALYFQMALLWLLLISVTLIQFISVSNNQFALQKRLKIEHFDSKTAFQNARDQYASKEERRIRRLEQRLKEDAENFDISEKIRRELVSMSKLLLQTTKMYNESSSQSQRFVISDEDCLD